MQMHIYIGEAVGGNTGQSDEVSTVRDIGQLIKRGDISLVSRRGGSRLPGTGPGLWPPPTRHG